MSRISPEQLGPVRDVIFGDGRTGGVEVANAVGERHVTLWSWLNKRGLPADKAEALAEELQRRAARLNTAAVTLRSAARAAEGAVGA